MIWIRPTFRVALFTSASNAADLSLSTIGSVTSELSEAFGYSSSGKSLTASWVAGSANEFRFIGSGATVWSAAGGPIDDIKYGVIFETGGRLLCCSRLSTTQYSIPDGETFTLWTDSGIFTLH